ncbi:MAG: hypothetical protein GF353_14575 [Candidatus Lokiarchaeota archaeon]|nr:hypothetical protein [Candidatus Lokiarchaeota archaeon]
MKDSEIKQRFIEMRVDGASFETCANELGISKSKAIQWNKDLQRDINNLEFDKCQTVLGTCKLTKQKRVEFLAKNLEKIHNALENKSYEDMSVKELLILQEKFQTEMNELTKSTKYRTGEMMVVDPLENFNGGLGPYETERTLDLE